MNAAHFRRVCVIAAALAALALPGIARADAVIDWNEYAANALVGARQSPTAASLHMAMVNGAIYDAVNGIDRGYRAYLVLPDAQPWDSMDAAAATAAYRVLVSILPAQQAALDPLYQASLAAVPDGPAKDGGIAAGETAAAAMIAARTSDGRFGPFRFSAGFTPEAWRPELPFFASDPFAWVAQVKPFLVEGASQFRSDGPNALTSDAYAADVTEVEALGARDSATRTADQTEQALYWGAEHGALLLGRVAGTIAKAADLSLPQDARLFAMLDLAAADANINCWNDKAYWSSWRPITAIHLADTDGNPATDADPNWQPLLTTPPFPEHPSGHACATGSKVATLQNFFGTDKLTFTAFSAGSGTSRTFTRFSEMIKEVIDARIYAGIHFRTGDVQGAIIGKKTAHWVDKHYFQRGLTNTSRRVVLTARPAASSSHGELPRALRIRRAWCSGHIDRRVRVPACALRRNW
jgi:hypothetical protein